MKDDTDGLSYYVTKKVGKAIWDYRMIQDGDRILLAVSGGKDSLSLLRIMRERMKFVPIKYEIIACHVDMGFEWVRKDSLIEHFEREGVQYVVTQPTDALYKEGETFGCFWCSWTRRKRFYAMAKELGCSKIALGHHMDDITETLLLNLFFGGEICTMRPYQEMFGGEVALIRPLAYVEEQELVRFAESLGLPVIKSQCPHGKKSKRRLAKGMIKEAEQHYGNVKKNIFRSLQRVRPEYLLGYENIPVVPRAAKPSASPERP
ncbi:MAG TPA: ATP-binding protein [Syntrophorhabdales bacterium]|nr:ATP-binding protein [Syntrophorhabdales bacterium]